LYKPDVHTILVSPFVFKIQTDEIISNNYFREKNRTVIEKPDNSNIYWLIIRLYLSHIPSKN